MKLKGCTGTTLAVVFLASLTISGEAYACFPFGCDTHFRKCAFECPLRDDLSCADGVSQLDGVGGFFWNAVGHCRALGSDRAAIVECAWRETIGKYPGLNDPSCVKQRLLASLSTAQAIDKIAGPPPPPPPPPPPACVAKSFSNDEIFTATSLTTPPASTFWCGHDYRLSGRDLNPNPDTYSDGTFTDVCHSRARKEDGSFVPAQIRAEVRGWLRTSMASPTNFEQEITFDVEPDIGWQPNTPDVWPVNTFERVAQLMRPLADENSAGHFHVEYNLWAPVRVCGVLPDWRGHSQAVSEAYWNNGAGPFCASWVGGTTGNPKRPPEWCFSFPGVVAPLPFDFNFPPHTQDPRTPCDPKQGCKLDNGDYVRIVGTLWEDENHNWDQTPPNHPNRCYAGGRTRYRGWTEIHPVDFIARIPPPTHSSNGISYVNVCLPSGSTQSTVATAQVTPRDPRPPGSYQLRVHEIVDPAFTNFQSIGAAYQTESNRIRVTGEMATVTVEVSSLWEQRKGMFHAAYQATWEACQPQCSSKCGGAPDGCGGTCATICATGETCSAWHCCPNSQTWCGGRCKVRCPQSCEPCWCGGISCDGSAACRHACAGRRH